MPPTDSVVRIPAPAPERENRLLLALPAATRAWLAPRLAPVTLTLGQLLADPTTPLLAVYFPASAVVSLRTPLEDGPTTEAALIGPEGLVGLPLVLGLDHDAHEALVQVPGTAWRLAAADLYELLAMEPAVRPLLDRFTQLLLVSIARTAACAYQHALPQRCARWLLATQDRAGAPAFPLTHAFLAAMLGVRRAGVTEAVGQLQQAGLIRYRRGRMTVLDQAGLEAAACSCYRYLARLTDQLVPPATRTPTG